MIAVVSVHGFVANVVYGIFATHSKSVMRHCMSASEAALKVADSHVENKPQMMLKLPQNMIPPAKGIANKLQTRAQGVIRPKNIAVSGVDTTVVAMEMINPKTMPR